MIEIEFNGVKYNIDKDKLLCVLAKLNNDTTINNALSEQEINELMVKFGLLDEYFLENVNRL